MGMGGTRKDLKAPSVLLVRKEVAEGAYCVPAGTLVPIPES